MKKQTLTPLEQQLYVMTQSKVHAKLIASIQTKPSEVSHPAAEHAMAAVQAMRLQMLSNGNGNGKTGKRNNHRGAK